MELCALGGNGGRIEFTQLNTTYGPLHARGYYFRTQLTSLTCGSAQAACH